MGGLRDILFIALGGALGAVSRYLTSVGVQRFAGESFPLGTLLVNVVGCLLLGVAAEYGVSRRDALPPYLLKALTVGFLGALTTFSTFGLDTLRVAEKDWRLGALNVVANLVVGLLAVGVGLWIGKSIYQ